MLIWLTKVPLAIPPNLIQSRSGGLAGGKVVDVSGNKLERQIAVSLEDYWRGGKTPPSAFCGRGTAA